MKNNILPLFILSLLFFTCKKDKTFQLQWNEISSPTSLTLNAIHFINDSIGHIVGGDTWVESVYLKTKDAGKTWELNTLQEKEIFNLNFNQNKNGFAVGLGGDFYFKENQQADWQYQNLFFPSETFRDVSFWGNENGIIVTGGSFTNGKIIHLDENFQGEVVDSFEQELAAVYHSEKNIVHAVGYGIVLRSTDGGLTWEKKNIIGDFFRAIHFPSTQVGYAVGHSGSIIKTTDAGNTWDFIRNGDNISTSNKQFRSVFFVSDDLGFIVGEKGIFWKTENGGSNWEVAADFPEVDLHDVFVIGRKGYMVGKEGRIFSFSF